MRKLEIQDNNSLRANVFKELEQAILNGNFAPGDSLIEQRLSAELGVSRTPVREALRQLELEGLVKTVPNKGAVVIGVSAKDILDIYSIRMKIEALAARWAATNITDEELDALRGSRSCKRFMSAAATPCRFGISTRGFMRSYSRPAVPALCAIRCLVFTIISKRRASCRSKRPDGRGLPLRSTALS